MLVFIQHPISGAFVGVSALLVLVQIVSYLRGTRGKLIVPKANLN
jgi:hypothetical protein